MISIQLIICRQNARNVHDPAIYSILGKLRYLKWIAVLTINIAVITTRQRCYGSTLSTKLSKESNTFDAPPHSTRVIIMKKP